VFLSNAGTASAAACDVMLLHARGY